MSDDINLVREVRATTEFKTFKKLVITIQGKLKIDRDREEVLTQHSSRTSRSIRGADRYSPKKLLEASWQDLSVRSRMAEIRVKASLQLDELEEACETLRSFVFVEYRDEMRAFSNEKARQAVITRILGKTTTKLMSDAQSLLGLIDFLIKDLDQSSYLLSNNTKTLELIDPAKGKVL